MDTTFFVADTGSGTFAGARASLARLARLGEGWLGGVGARPTPRALDGACGMLVALESSDAPAPRVYPTVAGGVTLEWVLGQRVVEAEISPMGRIEVCVCSLEADTETRSDRLSAGAVAELVAELAHLQ
jgi:hypothetical protein